MKSCEIDHILKIDHSAIPLQVAGKTYAQQLAHKLVSATSAIISYFFQVNLAFRTSDYSELYTVLIESKLSVGDCIMPWPQVAEVEGFEYDGRKIKCYQ